MNLHLGPNDPVGPGKRRLDIAQRHGGLQVEIVAQLVKDRRPVGIEGLPVGHDRLEGLDFLDDEFQRVFCDIPVLRDDKCYRVTYMAYLVRDQRIEPGQLHARHEIHAAHGRDLSGLGQPFHVLAGVDGDHPGQTASFAHVQGAEPPVRHLAPEEGGVEHSREDHVVHITALTGQQAGVLHPA